MFSRRKPLIAGVLAIGSISGCLGSEDRPCDTSNDGPGCDTETVAWLLEDEVQSERDIDIDVRVNSSWFSDDDLDAVHTTSATGSFTGGGDNGTEAIADIESVAYWYSAAVNDEFDVGDLDGTFLYSLDSEEELGYYEIDYDWADEFINGEQSEEEYYATVLDTFEVP